MSKADAADSLADAIFALDDVDLNPVLDDDVRTLLDAKDDLRNICRRLRQDHRADQRLAEQEAETDD